MAKKYVNTVVVRDNTELNGVEIIFAIAPTEEVKNHIKGKVTGYKGMQFSWNARKCLWWDYNSKAMKKALDKYLDKLRTLNYLVRDERTVAPTRATRPNTGRPTNTRRRGARHNATNTAKATAPVTPVVEETAPVVEAPVQTTGYTKYDVQMRALEIVAGIIEMNR